MTIFDIVKFNSPILEQFSKLNISVNDYKNAEIYEAFLSQKNKGYKISYITIKLAEQYNCSQRTIYNIVRKMEEKIL